MVGKSDQHEPFHTLEMQNPSMGMYSGPGASPSRSKMGVCHIAWLSATTLLGIISLIIACWATNEVKNIPRRDTYLLSNPWPVPKGHKVFPLGTGLGYWTPEPQMLHARSDHAVVTVYGRAYLIGGLSNDTDGNPVVINSTTRYNPVTGYVMKMADMPEPRYRFAYTRINDTIYIMGGTWSPDRTKASATRGVWKYTVTEDRWERMADMSEPRFDGCAAYVNNKIYIAGGYNQTYHSLNDIEEYDIKTNTWTRYFSNIHLMKTPRGDCRAAAYGGKMYVFGGKEYTPPRPDYDCSAHPGQCHRFLKSVEMFDPKSKTWTNKAYMHDARADFGIDVLVDTGRIIVIGGETSSGDLLDSVAMAEVEEYNPVDNVWVTKAPLPEARFKADAAAIGDKVYVFGGNPTCGYIAAGKINATECHNAALNTVFCYHDIEYPDIYAIYKP